MNKVVKFIKANKTLTVFFTFLLGTGTALATGGTTADFSPMFTEVMALLEGDVGRLITAWAIGWGFFKILQQDWVIIYCGNCYPS